MSQLFACKSCADCVKGQISSAQMRAKVPESALLQAVANAIAECNDCELSIIYSLSRQMHYISVDSCLVLRLSFWASKHPLAPDVPCIAASATTCVAKACTHLQAAALLITGQRTRSCRWVQSVPAPHSSQLGSRLMAGQLRAQAPAVAPHRDSLLAGLWARAAVARLLAQVAAGRQHAVAGAPAAQETSLCCTALHEIGRVPFSQGALLTFMVPDHRWCEGHAVRVQQGPFSTRYA